jgi:toxin ParE1/3/4
MSRFILSRAARSDFLSIINYIKERSGKNAAQHVADDFNAAFNRLVKYPNEGHTREELDDQTLRVVTVHTYLIIFWPDTKPLQIARIISGYRNLWTMRMPKR